MKTAELTLSLPRFLPLSQAAEELGVSEDVLRKQVENGTILSGILQDGSVIVAVNGEKTIELPHTEPSEASPPVSTEPRPLPLAVAGDDINAHLAAIRREDFAHLEGRPITVSEAAEKYGVPVSTIHRWVQQGYIKAIANPEGRGRKKILDEASVAFCAEIYKVRKTFRVVAPLLDDQGNPYLLKYPDLARLRRAKR